MKNNTLTVIGYNIHKGMSPLNRVVNLMQMGEQLQKIMPDVLCLQEVQGQNLRRISRFDRYPSQCQSAWLGEFLAFNDCYGKNAIYQNGHHGNAILSKYPLNFRHNMDLTVNRLEKRGMMHCEIVPNGWSVGIVVLCCHLNLLQKDRVKQYQLIQDYIENEIDPNQPLILAGDFNDWTQQSSKILSSLGMVEVFESMQGHFVKSFPAKLPLLCLDRMYVRNLNIIQIIDFEHKDWKNLSDHLPIGAVLGLP